MQRSRHPRLRRAAPWIAVSTLVLGHALLREPSLRGLAWLGADVGVEALAARGRDTRVATWNLENFPRADQDLARLAARLRALEADVIAVQEVHDRDALARLVPEPIST